MTVPMPEFLEPEPIPAWLEDCTHEPPCGDRDDCEDACYRCRPEQTCIEHLARAREDAAHHSADMNRSDR